MQDELALGRQSSFIHRTKEEHGGVVAIIKIHQADRPRDRSENIRP